jgi:glycosyltransferase involved in cell wall biosynthesis
MNPIVSIIVPCYNQAQYLAEALDSVYAQTYPYWECIIINDGSPDNTEEVAMLYCRKDGRFKYTFKENGGHSSARNMGIRLSTGKYILPLDGDDKIAERYLEKGLEVLERDNNVKVVAGYTQLFGDKSEEIRMPPYDFKKLLTMSFLYNSSMYRRIDYEKTKGYDETMLGYEDWNLWISLLKDGGIVYELSFTSYYYRVKEVSIFQDFIQDKRRFFLDALKLYNNQADSYEKYFDSPIALIQENEKLNRVIEAYHQSRTYKWGMKIQRLMKFLKPGSQ